MTDQHKKDLIGKLRAMGFTISEETELHLTLTLEELLMHTKNHNDKLLKSLEGLNPEDLSANDKEMLEFLTHIIIA